MNSIVLKVLGMLPWFKIAQWLLAEAGWQRDVAAYLAAEEAWYFRLAAIAWGQLQPDDPPSAEDVLKLLLKDRAT